MLQTILARAGLPALVKRQRERGESFGELAGTFGELRGASGSFGEIVDATATLTRILASG